MIRTYAPMLLYVLGGCSGGGGDADGNTVDPVALVSLATAQQGNVAQTATLYGAVEQGSESQYTLSAPAEAVVESIAAPVGSAVSRGQTVVRLRASPTTRSMLTRASADATTADAAYARAKRLRADGLTSDAEVETARAAAQSALALLGSLKAQAGGLNLKAPGPGHVATVVTNPGDLVQSGTTIATITKFGDLRARFGVEPGLAKTLKPGSPLRIMPTTGGAPFGASILSIDPTIDPQTRLASVFVRVPAGQGVGSGQPMTAQVAVAQSGGAITLPYAALLDDGGQSYVFVVQGGVAHRRDVTTGATGGDRVAIAKGVAVGDKVVVQGGTAIDDGMKFRTK